jgi:hypothetical protein
MNPAQTIGQTGTPTANQTTSFTDINIGAGTYKSSIVYGAPTVSAPGSPPWAQINLRQKVLGAWAIPTNRNTFPLPNNWSVIPPSISNLRYIAAAMASTSPWSDYLA